MKFKKWMFIPFLALTVVAVSVKAEEAKTEKKEVKEEKKEIKQTEKAVQKDIVATLENDAKFTTLLSALKTAKLVETLKGPGPYTILAPSNDAFKKLPPGTLDSLLKDTPKLEKVLLYHVVPGKKPSKEVMTLSSVKTSQGTEITIKVKDGKILADNAQLVSTDIPTANGVIHVIDTVLMPKP